VIKKWPSYREHKLQARVSALSIRRQLRGTRGKFRGFVYIIFLDQSGSPYIDYKTYSAGYAKHLTQDLPRRFPPYPFFILAALGLQESHTPIVDDWFTGAE
jgi:hypothetical protein